MVETRRLIELTKRVADKVNLPEDDLVVGLSGGADSAALAYLSVLQGVRLRALHIDHGLSVSPLMRGAAEQIAKILDLDLQVVEVDVPEGSSPEGQARRVRYAAFLEATPGETLVLGHTLDDQAETVLMNILRGAGPNGVTGIPAYRPPNIHRPLLEVTRAETHEIAALAGLPFTDDPMNYDLGLRRNVIRLEVLPRLRHFNPQVTQSLTRLAGTVRADSRYLDRISSDVGFQIDDSAVGLPVGELIIMPEAIANRVIMRLARILDARLTYEDLGDVSAVARREVASAQLSSGVSTILDGPILVLRRDVAKATPEQVRIELTPGNHSLGRIEFEVDLVEGVCRVAPIGTWRAIFPADAVLIATGDASGVVVLSGGEPAWIPGSRRFPVAFYEPGASDYLSVSAREKTGWTSNH